jgi:hypothetical protein
VTHRACHSQPFRGDGEPISTWDLRRHSSARLQFAPGLQVECPLVRLMCSNGSLKPAAWTGYSSYSLQDPSTLRSSEWIIHRFRREYYGFEVSSCSSGVEVTSRVPLDGDSQLMVSAT